MKKEKLQYNIYNSMRIVYLDSSCLIRNYPIKLLSKILTRKKYTSNPSIFTEKLNILTSPLSNTSALFYEFINSITKCSKNFYVITCDCMFPISTNRQIYTLFGSFNYKDNVAIVNNKTVLFEEKISVEAFFNASTLIRSANLILLDDYFISLSIGRQLLNRKKDETSIITLSSIIGYSSYCTEEVLNTLNLLF